MIRSFIAIKFLPDEEFLRAFNVLKSQLKNEKINWVDINNLHLTLKFLGDVSDENIKNIRDELSKMKPIPSFKFELDGIHLFKDIRTPRVIYSEVKAGPNLDDLAREIDHCLIKFKLFQREKLFLPHLTMGRIKFLREKENLELVLRDFRKVYFQQAECREFHLFESTLTPSGPIYTIIETFKLL